MVFGKNHCLIVAVTGGFEVVEEAVRISQSLPDVGSGEEPAILRLLCQLQAFLRTILSHARVASRLRAFADFLFDAGVLAHALEKPSPRHEDVVALFLAQAEG